LNETQIISTTKNWVEHWVLAHQLCPFAKKPFQLEQIRYVAVLTDDWRVLLNHLVEELAFLKNTAPEVVETTLIAHPNVLTDFEQYLDFLEQAEEVIEALDLEGVFQLASFHPDYQFAGTKPDDASNYTNRSPFPLLHLLREDRLEEALEHYPDADQIPERNIQHMESLGTDRLKQELNEINRTP